ncbi:GTP cyclohydrolase I [Thermosporothrix hazakensis]|uniref:GTP cyclohydrolase 1 n=2 Tax=Thermosporothrix TaxID=768650 RepID=A0A326UDL0_THEHA|nr:GTP cyclohydrolase I [Thermosporothrix hazakensis]PZW32824.1 GTP cyclohydrolase I [Thermosporothrix hazakensis]BBH90805.1 GTP cyclohydrolase 1 [Thermosporothrix sp. COM3]GCE48855.1 GTP cyclohydrolase 1 [Thermosporothrix hazakensis]
MTLNIDLDDLDFQEAIHLKHRHISVEDMQKFEGYIAEIFAAMGMDVNTPSTRETPQRFLKAMFDATEGYDGDPKLIKVFDAEYPDGVDGRRSQVIEGPIPFFSLCEHHAFPFFGHAYVGYIANQHIIGLSKLTRLVRVFAKRFSVQERLTQQIASTLETILQPHGVAVYLEANHLCMAMRGVRETSALTRTTSWRGEYEANPELRSEFFSACQIRS